MSQLAATLEGYLKELCQWKVPSCRITTALAYIDTCWFFILFFFFSLLDFFFFSGEGKVCKPT